MNRLRRSQRMSRVLVESLESRRLLTTYYMGEALPAELVGAATLLDGSNGSTPIDKANALDLNPGDTLFLDGSGTFTGNLRFDKFDAGGTDQANAVAVTSYGVGQATILAGNGDGIYVENAGGFDISNLQLIGASNTSGINYDKVGGGKNHPAGINFVTNDNPSARRNYVRISDIDVTGFWQAGVYFQTSVKTDWSGYNAGGLGYNDVLIERVNAHNTGNTGIEFIGGGIEDSTNVTVRNSQADYNAGHSGLSHNTGSGIILSSVKGGVIEDSEASYNGNPGYGGVGIWAWKAANITIEGNESHHNRTSTNKDGGGFDLDGGVTGSVMQYNYSHDNEGTGYGLFQYRGAPAWGNNVVRYNISRNDARANDAGGICLWNGGSGVQNVDIYGNTIYMDKTGLKSGATPRAVYITTKTTNIRFYNNIIMTREGIPLMDIAGGQSGMIFKGNDLFADTGFNIRWGKSYSDLAKWQRGTGQSGNFSTAPIFVNNSSLSLGTTDDFRLDISSPLKDAGLNLWAVGLITLPGYSSGPGSEDYYGDLLPGPGVGGFAIGADEI